MVYKRLNPRHFQSVVIQMSFKQLVLIFAIFATASCTRRLQLNSTIVPVHYDVELTIDVSTQRYFVQESILISVLEDTDVIEINQNGLTTNSWLTSARLVSEDGEEFPYIDVNEDSFRESISLIFFDTIPGDANYTLYFTDIEGSFDGGLVQVPLSTDNDSSD